ncbi:MAG: gamma-glutamylcyclotransferase [Pseudomonadales bacterium]|nr:gamma-glutamylcyclotransferase [Pseudomonadales bacterium]
MPVPFDADGGFWLFGYGSLIWNPDVPFDDRRPARLRGWARRFWQGSHDHRGTPEAPGRVVTLIEAGDAFVDGLAFRIPGGEAKEILARLDHREKNGYARHALALESAGPQIHALVYVAEAGNFAWLGPDDADAMALQIHRSRGPSGSNREYLLSLDAALRALSADDPHVFDLADRVRRMNA